MSEKVPMTIREINKKQSLAHIPAMRQRVQALYRQGSNTRNVEQVMQSAFEELALAIEELQAADESLRLQHDEWQNRYAEIELECQRYKDLFEHAPVGYVVTSLDGAIRQANQAAAHMLQSNARLLVGRSLALFVPDGHRRAFRHNIERLALAEGPQDWDTSLQSWKGELFNADLTVGVFRGASGRPVALYWLVRDVSARRRSAVVLSERIELETSERSAGLAILNTSITGDMTVRQQLAFIAEACLRLAGTEQAYSPAEQELAAELARRVATAIEQARVSQEAFA